MRHPPICRNLKTHQRIQGQGAQGNTHRIQARQGKECHAPLLPRQGAFADAGCVQSAIHIADSTNHRIVITTLEGKKIAIAGSGKEGFKNGKFAEVAFSDPQGMCLDGDTLYVADRKNHTSFRALNLKDETVKTVAGTWASSPQRAGGKALETGLNSPWDLLLHDGKIFWVAMAGHRSSLGSSIRKASLVSRLTRAMATRT